MANDPINLDEIDAILADPLEERPWREITRALVEDLRRLCSDYDDLHDLYGTVTEQRDTARAEVMGELLDARRRAEHAEAAVARVRELHRRDDPKSRYPRCTACLGAHWPCTTVDALDGGEGS